MPITDHVDNSIGCLLLNIYDPNKPAEQCEFFSKLSDLLKSQSTDSETSLIVGRRGGVDEGWGEISTWFRNRI